MQTDPTLSVLKLLSLVAYTEGDRCGLRSPWETTPALAQDPVVAGQQMCRHYAGAVRYVQNGDPDFLQDYRDLPDFTLPFVTNADADVEQLLGLILIRTLGLQDEVNAGVIGRKWLGEVLNACWTAKLTAARVRYGIG